MRADTKTQAAIRQLVERTYLALSTPGSELGEVFGHADLAVAGSGIGELLHGPQWVYWGGSEPQETPRV